MQSSFGLGIVFLYTHAIPPVTFVNNYGFLASLCKAVYVSSVMREIQIQNQITRKCEGVFRMRQCAIFLLVFSAVSLSLTAAEKKQKLKIVFLMGQSNMVGYSHPRTAWYLTQPMYVPPAKTAEVKSRFYDPRYFYWQGLNFAEGSTPGRGQDRLHAGLQRQRQSVDR